MLPAFRSRTARLAMVVTAAALLAPATATAPAVAGQATGDIRYADAPGAIPNSYIVVFKNSVPRSRIPALAHPLAAQHGGRLHDIYTAALGGFAVSMSEQDARLLTAHPSVDYVAQDIVVRATGTQPNPPSWGLDRVDQPDLPLDNSYTYPNTASAVTVYIIDSGIRIGHADFGGRASYGIDVVDGDLVADDCYGHGTAVAGVAGGNAHGVAKGVTLVAVRVTNCVGDATDARTVLRGIDFVTASVMADPHPAVANLSFVADIVYAPYDTAVSNSIAAGVTYAISAANNSTDACGNSPAGVPEAITVGATDITDTRAPFSNVGPCVDLFAPGVDITMPWATSDTATITLDGTSFSAPHAAGVAAMILAAHPGYTPAQVHAAVVNSAVNRVNNPGPDSPNLLLQTGP